MSAEVVRNPQASIYDPEWSSGLMVECQECGIEWGWGVSRQELQGYADKHNAETLIHQDVYQPTAAGTPDTEQGE